MADDIPGVTIELARAGPVDLQEGLLQEVFRLAAAAGRRVTIRAASAKT